MGFLQRFLAANNDRGGVLKAIRRAEVMNSPAYYTGERYTDPLTKATVEPPTMAEYGEVGVGIGSLIALPFVLQRRMSASQRPAAAVPVAVPYTPGVPTPMAGAVMGHSYAQSYEQENPEPFVVINGQSVPREFTEMYEHGLDEVCFHGEGQQQGEPH